MLSGWCTDARGEAAVSLFPSLPSWFFNRLNSTMCSRINVTFYEVPSVSCCALATFLSEGGLDALKISGNT